MFQCQDCLRNIQRSLAPPLCPRCYDLLVELRRQNPGEAARLDEMVWPHVRRLLVARMADRLYADPWCWDASVPAMVAAFTTLWADEPPLQDLSDSSALAARVQYMSHVWQAQDTAGQRYGMLAAGVDPLLECLSLFLTVIRQRRLSRRYLHRRFRVDISRGVLLPGARAPRSQYEMGMLTVHTQLHGFFRGIFLAGLRAVVTATRDGTDPASKALEAMRAAPQRLLPELVTAFLASPYSFQREATAISVAGHLRPFIRMYPSVRQVLGQYGEPRAVLLERLPADVLEAHAKGARSGSELLASVRRLLNQVRREQPENALHLTLEPTSDRREGDHPGALEEWAAKEAAQRLQSLIPCAGLSPRESEYFLLHLRGLSYSTIASQKGVAVGTVKTTMFRAVHKLRNAAGS